MKLSPLKAIHAHCKGCIYDPKAGGSWVEQVEACTVTKCELYDHRKLTSKTRAILREKELAMLSPEQRDIAIEKSIKKRETFAKTRNKMTANSVNEEMK